MVAESVLTRAVICLRGLGPLWDLTFSLNKPLYSFLESLATRSGAFKIQQSVAICGFSDVMDRDVYFFWSDVLLQIFQDLYICHTWVWLYYDEINHRPFHSGAGSRDFWSSLVLPSCFIFNLRPLLSSFTYRLEDVHLYFELNYRSVLLFVVLSDALLYPSSLFVVLCVISASFLGDISALKVLCQIWHAICNPKKCILTDLHQTLQIDSPLLDPYFLKI